MKLISLQEAKIVTMIKIKFTVQPYCPVCDL